MGRVIRHRVRVQIRQQPNCRKRNRAVFTVFALAIFSDRFGESLAQTHVVSIEAVFLLFFE